MARRTLFLLLGLLACAQAARAELAGGHEVWIVSSRSLPGCSQAFNAERLSYSVFNGESFAPSDAGAFYGTLTPERPVCVLVHGSPATHGDLITYSLQIYPRILELLPENQPVRLVFWSWPAARYHEKRILKDMRRLADVSEAHGYYVAWFTDRIPPEIPVSLVGYSMGARTTCTALQLLATGRGPYCPYLERQNPVRQAPLRVALLAAAIDRSSLYPGYRYGKALEPVDAALVTTSRCDWILKYYYFLGALRQKKGPEACGRFGVGSFGMLGAYRERYMQIDVTYAVGESHDMNDYFNSVELRPEFARVALFSDR